MPGGFIEADEKIIKGITRELYEETQIDMPEDKLLKFLREVKVFDDPKRSTRGRIITNVGFFILDKMDKPKVMAADDADCAIWVSIKDFINMSEKIFSDHFQIIGWFLRNYDLK